jgi:hypothetical protein
MYVRMLNINTLVPRTDKKEEKISLIYKEIQKGSGAWLTPSSYMTKSWRIFSYIRKPFLIYDFALDPIWISLYMRKNLFSFFISVV